jgi:lauroyl/myristoyl acyltransferase
MAGAELRSAADRDLDAEIADLERPRAREMQVRGLSLAARVYSIAALHRVVPDRLALRIAWAVGWLRWYWPPARRRAIARVQLTVARTPRAGEARALARRELSIHAMRLELGWHPRLVMRAPFEGLERLERVRSSGQPVVLTSAHIDHGTANAVIARGYVYATAAGAWLDPDATVLTGYASFKARRMREWGEALGIKFVTAGGSHELLRALLERGEMLFVMCDVPGRMRTRMAGKTAHLASGPAALAYETGAAVVPIVSQLHADGPRLEALEPIDARRASGAQEIADRLAAIYGDLMVRHPEQVEPTGFTRGSFVEDSEGYPLSLWFPPPIRERAKAKASRALAAMRRLTS